MPVYLISYDLHKPDRDYFTLHEKLNSLEAVRLTESVWAIRSNLKAAYLCAEIVRYVDGDDDIVVTQITREYDAAGLNKDHVRQTLEGLFLADALSATTTGL